LLTESYETINHYNYQVQNIEKSKASVVEVISHFATVKARI